MPILLDQTNIILIVTVVLNFILGVLIYLKGRNREINRIYAWNIFHIISWVLAMIFFRSAPPKNALLWCVILYITPTFIASSFLFFTYVFPTRRKDYNNKKILLIFGINFLLVILIIIPGAIIKQVNFIGNAEKIIVFGKYYFLYVLYTLVYFSYGFVRLLKKYFQSISVEKSQIIYLLTGYSLAANSAFVTNLILPWLGYFKLNWLGQVLTVFMVAYTAYAIIKHRLMDIKFVLRKSSVYLFSLGTIIILAVSVRAVIEKFFSASNGWMDSLILIAALAAYPALRKSYYHLANKYFFSSLYDSREIIVSVSNALRATLDISRIYDILYKTLDKAFHLRSFGFLSYDQATDSFLTRYNINFNIGRRVRFENNPVLASMYADSSKPLIVEELKQNYYNAATKDIIDLLLNFHIEILMPLNIKDRTIGLLVLGSKESHDIYNDEDLQLIEVVAAQAATAIENALLYEETKNFNVVLREKVKKATRDLRHANEKLRRLDQAKSEFISIASHQLRTPLTVIKGYISMLLEGNFGKLNSKEKDALEKVYQSNERLIQLVENLLNISRIEADRIQFVLEKVQPEELVGSVVEELKQNADKKGLQLLYKKPAKPLPVIFLDQEKIRQVILNLIDNAIKYTSKGKVVVKIKKDGGYLEMCVIDTGIGIKPEDKGNFFKKFERGSGTSLIHTEGTGLGLYVAKRMVEAHRGQIWAESPGENRGSCFCFRIPYNIKSKGIKKIEKEEV